MNSIPEEILENIFEIGCDFEFNDVSGLTQEDISRASERRTLKPFLRPAAHVCKAWRNLIIGKSTFWITSLDGTQSNKVWCLKEVFGDSNDDIDLTFPNFSTLGLSEVQEWLRTHFLPFSHRYRKLIIVKEQRIDVVRSIFQEIALIRFPRLRGLAIHYSLGHALAPFHLIAPKLLSLGLHSLPRNPDSSLFNNLTSLEFSQYRPGGHPNSLDELRSSLEACSSTLVTLYLNLLDDLEDESSDHADDLEGEPSGLADNRKIHLPRLSKCLFICSPHNVTEILGIFDTPALVHLGIYVPWWVPRMAALRERARAHFGPVRNTAIRSTPYMTINSIQHMVIHAPIIYYPLLLEHIRVPNATTLCLHWDTRESSTSSTVLPISEKVQFNELLNLDITWTGALESNRDPRALESLNPLGLLEFPKLQDICVRRIRDLDLVSAPTIQRLTIPLDDPSAKEPWFDLNGVNQLQVDNITCLQLYRLSSDKPMPNIRAEHFKHFKNVKILALAYDTIPLLTCCRPSHWKEHLLPGFVKRRLVFPNLVTLEVHFREIVPSVTLSTIGRRKKPSTELFTDLWVTQAFEEIEEFLSARKRLGHPVHSLKLYHCPPVIRQKAASLAREVDKTGTN